MKKYKLLHNVSLFSDFDINLFKGGNHFKLYEKLGSHIITVKKKMGTYFAIWAPNAKKVSVIGDFNNWNQETHHLTQRWDESGIWECFITDVGKGDKYKYKIISNYDNYQCEKGDPFAFRWESPPKTASVVWDLNYKWHDKKWLNKRAEYNRLDGPISVYEMHLGSWKRVPEEFNRFLNYREIAEVLPDYIKSMGFTHVEFLPVMEHPFYGSWGYQCTGFFSPTSRYGRPEDLMYLIDCLHQNNIGVILDWVPSHFPVDIHSIGFFDGTHLYEHSDPKKGFHPDWGSYIFNYGRNEIKSFLISSSIFWLEKYHIDSIRMDAVASMLYLDYSRKEGEWIPNKFGGRENLEAIDFIKLFNESVYKYMPDTQTIAEESTAWPMVSSPTNSGGLGFGMKWNMGWMHDTLNYFSKDSIHRKHHQDNLTFSPWYAFYENFILPLSHDEVVHGKKSLLSKMPGDEWQKFANLRALYGYMWGHPGKKLLFMGGEIGQWCEWDHDSSLDWHLLEYDMHKGLQKWVKDLNKFYKNEPCLYEIDFSQMGFEWIDFQDAESSIICFLRKCHSENTYLLIICNFTPVLRSDYKIGVPSPGLWKECLNSDAEIYGGSGNGNCGGILSSSKPAHGKDQSISITLPPLSVVFFKN